MRVSETTLDACSCIQVSPIVSPGNQGVYQFVLKLVEQHGNLAGMLRTVSVPVSHVGYQLPAPGEGVDLQYMQLTASLAVTAMQSYAQHVHAGCAALGWQLPAAPTRPVLLQTTPDLLCADWEQLQRSLESPAIAPEAALGDVAGSVAAALAAAAGVAQAVARGDTAAAVAAAQQATEAAAAALTAAGGIQQQFAGLGTSQQSAAGLDEAVWADIRVEERNGMLATIRELELELAYERKSHKDKVETMKAKDETIAALQKANRAQGMALAMAEKLINM